MRLHHLLAAMSIFFVNMAVVADDSIHRQGPHRTENGGDTVHINCYNIFPEQAEALHFNTDHYAAMGSAARFPKSLGVASPCMNAKVFVNRTDGVMRVWKREKQPTTTYKIIRRYECLRETELGIQILPCTSSR